MTAKTLGGGTVGVQLGWDLEGVGEPQCAALSSAPEPQTDLASHLTVWPRGQIDTPRTSGNTFLFVGLYVGKAQNYMCFHW